MEFPGSMPSKKLQLWSSSHLLVHISSRKKNYSVIRRAVKGRKEAACLWSQPSSDSPLPCLLVCPQLTHLYLYK